MDALVVDWLGRGGIAQTAEAWSVELEAAGVEATIITRGGRELDGSGRTLSPAGGGPAPLAHLRLCRFTAQQVRARRPDVVVVQNYVIPPLEEVVHRAAREVGARVVFVLHDDRHHERGEGVHLGLARQLRRADLVVTHSAAVAASVGRDDVITIPHPVPVGMLRERRPNPLRAPSDRPLALHFGVLRRAYKGTDAVVALAAVQPRWSFAFAGVGAPRVEGCESLDRFLEPAELVAAVQAADAVVLPYRHTTQSGAVVLAQLCGTPPVVSAVDGIVEQVEDGRTGLLVPPGAGVERWRAALDDLSDPKRRRELGRSGRDAVLARHEDFRTGVVRAVFGPGRQPCGTQGGPESSSS